MRLCHTKRFACCESAMLVSIHQHDHYNTTTPPPLCGRATSPKNARPFSINTKRVHFHTFGSTCFLRLCTMIPKHTGVFVRRLISTSCVYQGATRRANMAVMGYGAPCSCSLSVKLVAAAALPARFPGCPISRTASGESIALVSQATASTRFT